MTKTLFRSLIAASMLAAPSALAEDTKDPATDCARTKAWEARQQGWNLRALDAHQLHQGELYAWPMALAPGVSYRVISCGEEGINTLELLIVNGNGEVVARAEEAGREPTMDHAPESPERVHVVVRPRETNTAAALHTAIAVLYK